MCREVSMKKKKVTAIFFFSIFNGRCNILKPRISEQAALRPAELIPQIAALLRLGPSFAKCLNNKEKGTFLLLTKKAPNKPAERRLPLTAAAVSPLKDRCWTLTVNVTRRKCTAGLAFSWCVMDQVLQEGPF